MKKTSIFLSIVYFLILFSCTSNNTTTEPLKDRNVAFDAGWKFIRDSIQGAENPSFNDSAWRIVDLPHDWSIENIDDSVKAEHIGPFTKSSEGGISTGHVKGGTGWYRKHFTVDASYRSKQVSLCFDGVYMVANVWVNGKKAGDHFYGYTPFSFNITSLLKTGSDNVIAVEVKNKGKNSRWYSGSGIYRHVWLTVTNPLHIDENGVFITSSLPSKDTADVHLVISVKNSSSSVSDAKLVTTLRDKDGKELDRTENDMKVEPNGIAKIEQSLKIKSPSLWSIDSPALYSAIVEIISKGKVTDSYPVSFGVRTISFSATNGFLLNGSNIKMTGACMHHDNGLLGSATFDRAEERRIEIMKANGYNAIRTSHNPPSKQFLDACDRLGMLVIDEAFDMWEHPKNPLDYSIYFKKNWKSDLESMILRDRNHPSVIFWSIGNEIYERADTSGVRIAKQLVSLVKSLDKTRPVTQAVCQFWDHPGYTWASSEPAFASIDIGGYNYELQEYENDHKKFPERIMMGTESFPIQAYENWRQVEKNSWVIGDFVWTGMDYLGESGIGHVSYDKMEFSMPWPYYNSWCGDIDITGQKKAQSYFRDVVWHRSRLEMAVHGIVPAGKKEGISMWGWPDEYQSWTWTGNEGKTMQVSVYSDCQEVRLELNGKVIGQKPVSDKTKLTAKFDVPYAAGELKATGITDGKEVATKVFKTTGKPSSIRMIADRSTISANRNDLAYVTVEVVDGAGNLVPNADVKINLSVSGDGELIASGNAAPNDMESFRNPKCLTFNGRCLAIIRPFAKAGAIKLNAEAEGLPAATIDIATK